MKGTTGKEREGERVRKERKKGRIRERESGKKEIKERKTNEERDEYFDRLFYLVKMLTLSMSTTS